MDAIPGLNSIVSFHNRGRHGRPMREKRKRIVLLLMNGHRFHNLSNINASRPKRRVGLQGIIGVAFPQGQGHTRGPKTWGIF
jgi:hypothetical protein